MGQNPQGKKCLAEAIGEEGTKLDTGVPEGEGQRGRLKVGWACAESLSSV